MDVYAGRDGWFSGMPVSLPDPVTGKVSTLTCPPYGTAETEEFWKPVLDGLRERRTKCGPLAKGWGGHSGFLAVSSGIARLGMM